jgi:hypothetical protein
MTTLVVVGGRFHADTQLTDNGRVLRVRKLFRLPTGGVASGTGAFAAVYAACKWMQDGEKGEPPDLDNAEVVFRHPGGQLMVADGCWPAYPLESDEACFGSGSDIARALRAAGVDPGACVAAAGGIDIFTSGPVEFMDVCSVEFPGVQTYVPPKPKAAPKRKRK